MQFYAFRNNFFLLLKKSQERWRAASERLGADPIGDRGTCEAIHLYTGNPA